MKSNKQRRFEIKTKRLKKKEKSMFGSKKSIMKLNLQSIEADPSKLSHNFYYTTFIGTPFKYWDKPFKCRICGTQEIWTAKKQKWWHETAKGLLDSTAVHCKKCRAQKREKKEKQKEYMAAMAKKEPHPNEVFFKKRKR